MANYPGNAQEKLDFETVRLKRMQTHSSLSFMLTTVDASGNLTDTTLTPDLHFYLPEGTKWSDLGDTGVRVFASSRGGLEINGARRNDRQFRLDGPYDPARYTVDIPPPTGAGPHFWLMRTGFSAPAIGTLTKGVGDAGDIAEQAMHTPWVPRNPRKIDGPAQVREILELAA